MIWPAFNDCRKLSPSRAMQIRRLKAIFLAGAVLVLCFGCGQPIDPPENAAEAEAQTEDRRPLTFMGYACTNDCSGHQAGFDWAEERDIEDPDDCGGNSESFIEGCRAYAGELGPEDDGEDVS